MKLWIDDVRPAPEGWEWATNFDEAVAAFKNGEVTHASFDHDLGFYKGAEDVTWDHTTWKFGNYHHSDPTGYDLILWVVQEDMWPTEGCAVHSLNPVGHRAICDTIERYGPYGKRQHVVYEDEKSTYQLRATSYTKGEYR